MSFRTYVNQWTPATASTLFLSIILLAATYTVLFLLVHHKDNTDPKEQRENPHYKIQKH